VPLRNRATRTVCVARGGGSGASIGGTGGAGTGGTAGAPVMCDVTRPFGAPALVAGLNGATGTDDGTARLSADELTAVFYSDHAGYQIYTAMRASRTDPFSTPQAIGGIAAGAGGVLKFPTMTADGLNLFFESDPGGVFRVMVATRTTIAASFAGSAPVANLNAGSGDDSEPFVLADGSALYFMSTRNSASGTTQIYRAARGAGGQYLTPTQVLPLTPPSSEMAPVVTPDELVLYFGSDRTPNKGQIDIWMTKRASLDGPWDAPVNVQELNTSNNEIPDWISPDRCRLYFDRLGTTAGGDKIYVAERAP